MCETTNTMKQNRLTEENTHNTNPHNMEILDHEKCTMIHIYTDQRKLTLPTIRNTHTRTQASAVCIGSTSLTNQVEELAQITCDKDSSAEHTGPVATCVAIVRSRGSCHRVKFRAVN